MYTMTPFEKKHFDLLNAFHDFENDFFAGTGWSTCKVDVRDEGDKFVMEAELPGFEKEDIHLDVQGDCLKLSAEHHTDSEDKDDKKKYIRKERSEVSYQRSFDLTGIDAEKLDAELQKQLQLRLHRLQKTPALQESNGIKNNYEGGKTASVVFPLFVNGHENETKTTLETVAGFGNDGNGSGRFSRAELCRTGYHSGDYMGYNCFGGVCRIRTAN